MGNKKRIIALVGTPNSGKSSIFNHLTGLRQKVGNYAGVTVDRKYGSIRAGEEELTLVDLPGTHSLYAVSEDERVVVDCLLDRKDENHPDGIVYVADTSNLGRSLLLLTQVIDLGFPVVCCLNMQDVATNKGLLVDAFSLQKKLGIPVVRVNGRTGDGLQEAVRDLLKEEKQKKSFISPSHYKQAEVLKLKDALSMDDTYAAYLTACQFRSLRSTRDLAESLQGQMEGFSHVRAEVEDKKERISRIKNLLIGVESQSSQEKKTLSQQWDVWLTHPFWGSLIFLLVLFVMFQAIFVWAGPGMDLIDQAVAWFSSALRDIMPEGFFTNLLCDGIIAGIGGVIIFIPQIAMLFGLVAILEQSGYMSRAVYLSDKVMSRTGLNGRSLVSLISGVACAVPAIMAARTIGNWKERLITIFVTPFMSCSARLPVYIVLIAFIIEPGSYYGIVNKQGLVMFGLYMLGATAAILTSWLMSRMIKTNESSFLMLELPQYQWPQFRNVFLTIFEKTKVFVLEAGKIILVISIVLWVLSSFGPTADMDLAQQKAEQMKAELSLSEQDYENALASQRLEASYAGHLGKFFEPVIEPLGFDWKMGIAVITSFAAREVFVGTMATIYSTGSADDEATIIERMRSEKDEFGNPMYTPVRSLSLLLFYVFAMQCMSTLAIVKRETKSWLIPIAQFLVMTGLAYLVSLGVWQMWG